MVSATPVGQKPRDLAAGRAARLELIPEVTAVEVAGPGFINLRLAPAVWHARLGDILRAGTAYGDGDLGQEQGQGQAVNVEYVSANPNGPLPVGHARRPVVGDALSPLPATGGYTVTRASHVNHPRR